MSSLEDGFGGGVDDMVSANTAELRYPFWEVGYHGFTGPCRVALPCARASASSGKALSRCHGAKLQMNGTERTVPEANPAGILGFSN